MENNTSFIPSVCFFCLLLSFCDYIFKKKIFLLQSIFNVSSNMDEEMNHSGRDVVQYGFKMLVPQYWV